MTQHDLPMIVVYSGGSQGQRWVINQQSMLIGRGEDCDIVVEERRVSRHHARIEKHSDGYILRDLDSKNGTYVNGSEVRDEPHLLADGDEIQIALSVRMGFVGADATLPLSLNGMGMGLRLDKAARKVVVGGQEMVPPPSLAQFRLLELLYDRSGTVVSRELIVDAVWREEASDGISEQAVDALVRRLRERIATLDPNREYIVTVRGHGFRLDTHQ